MSEEKKDQKEKENRKQNERRPRSLHKRWGWLIAGAALAAILYLLFAPRWAGGPIADYRDSEAVARGQALYQVQCLVCHGPAGRGENPESPMGGTKPEGGYLAPALDGTGHAWHHAPDALFRVIKEGSPATDSQMVGWAGRMSDEEIGLVIAYFRSLWPQGIQGRYGQMFEQ